MFHKWKSFENHYNEKYLYFWQKQFPLNDYEFQVQEKIDGANFSFLFEPNKSPTYYKRSGIADHGFFNYRDLFNQQEYNDFVIKVQNYVDNHNNQLQFIGELFGSGIQNRISYGEGRIWRWFGIYENEVLVSLEREKELDEVLSIFNLRVPVIEDRVKLVDVFALDVELLTSRLCEFKPEGICIRNWGEPISFRNEYFLVKKKSINFMENGGNPGKKKKKYQINKEEKEVLDRVIDYVNENRTASLISKKGKLDDPKNFGDYMKAYVEDVFVDFDKDNDNFIKNMDKKENKRLRRNISSSIRGELLKSMQRN